MAIESVTAGNSAYNANAAAQQTRDTRATQQVERPPEPPREQRAEANKPQAPKPVVNAQGQTTGSRINVTA